jgi:hypothetical protein
MVIGPTQADGANPDHQFRRARRIQTNPLDAQRRVNVAKYSGSDFHGADVSSRISIFNLLLR